MSVDTLWTDSKHKTMIYQSSINQSLNEIPAQWTGILLNMIYKTAEGLDLEDRN